MSIQTRETRAWSVTSHWIVFLFALAAVLPFFLLVIASFTDNQTAMINGFTFFPEKWSLGAYEYIAREWATVGRSYLMTILVTLLGTFGGLFLASTYAYALSNRELPGHKILTFICIFTMLFNGGIVASYYVYTNLFHIKNTIWALVVPNLLMNAFTVLLIRNYFIHSINPSIMEAARIDGANEYRIFGTIVIPLSLPILATVGLMAAIAYWNDWINGLYYLTERDGAHLYTIQLVLNSINENVNFLANNSELLGTGATQVELPGTTIRMAIAVVGILPILIAYPFFQRFFVKGITMGAVKG